jgi:hypothetical protein
MLQLTRWFGPQLASSGAHGINVFSGSLKDCRAGFAGGEMVLERIRLFLGQRPYEIRLGDGFRVRGALVRIYSHYPMVARGTARGKGIWDRTRNRTY